MRRFILAVCLLYSSVVVVEAHNNDCKSASTELCVESNTSQQSGKSRAELIQEWRAWLLLNTKYSIYSHEGISAKHLWAINSLSNMFYTRDENIRGNLEMIQWVLDSFCPIPTPKDGIGEFKKIEKQVSSLLDFYVEYDGYKIRRKSAVARLLNEFKIKVYEEKLRSRIKDEEVLKLFDIETAAWNKYFESTSDAYGKIVLGKGDYNLKYVFWNNYDFDVMDHRYLALVCIYLNDNSVWNVSNQCRWDEVGYEYDNILKKLKQSRVLEYEYSPQDKIDALNADAETFKAFLNAHWDLTLKLNIQDEGYLLNHKVRTMKRMLDYYNRTDSAK